MSVQICSTKIPECPDGPIDMVLDTDAYNEIDDQYAIAYAAHATEKLRLKALYAAPFTNERSSGPADGMEKSYHEIHKLLKLMNKEEHPVFRGSESYLQNETTPIPSAAVQDLVQRAQDRNRLDRRARSALGRQLRIQLQTGCSSCPCRFRLWRTACITSCSGHRQFFHHIRTRTGVLASRQESSV